MTQAFMAGVNLGGWISQYSRYDTHHFDTFITGSDIEQIAGWGMDHVRLPVDYPVIEADTQPGVMRAEGFTYIDNCLEWCQARQIGTILDLHSAPGFRFQNTLQPETQALNTLFRDPAMQQRYISLWEGIARRYRGVGDTLAFELLNEVVLPNSDPWNDLAQRTITAVRAIDPQRVIFMGGNHYNAAAELHNLVLIEDPLVRYTFHFYEPLLFTHQKAPWTEVVRVYDQTLEYPGTFLHLRDFLIQHPEFGEQSDLVGKSLDQNLLRAYLQPALDFQQQTGRPLYCGEFGVIERAPRKSAVRWMRDFIALLRENAIGRAVWSYKQMDFGLVDGDGRVIDAELVRVVSQL